MKNKFHNIAIIGTTGAIGKAFLEAFLAQTETKSIFSFSRSQASFQNPKVTHHFLDLENESSIEKAASLVPEDTKLDLVIVATGILHGEDLKPEKSINDLSADNFEKLFAVNTTGPALIAKYFIPKLNQDQQSVMCFLSARVGSISDNLLGGWYAYRASKAALNMVIKNLSIELKRASKNLIITGLHPGTVDSTLSKPFQGNVPDGKLFSPEYAVSNLVNVIENLSPEDSGKCIDFNGIEIES